MDCRGDGSAPGGSDGSARPVWERPLSVQRGDVVMTRCRGLSLEFTSPRVRSTGLGRTWDMGFAINYRSTRPVGEQEAAAIVEAAEGLNEGRQWLDCEPVFFFLAPADGHLEGG